MEKKRRLLLGGIMSLVMVLAMIPGMAFAEEGDVCQIDDTSYRSLEDAINNANTGDVIELTQDFSLKGNVTVNKDVTLDLNGHTLTAGSYSLKIGGGDLTIEDSGSDGKITGTGYIVDMNTAGGDTVNLESGTLEGTAWTAVIRVASGDTFNMTGGAVRQTQPNVTTVVQLMPTVL